MSKMLWIVPSRSRPQNVAQLISAFHATRVQADLLIAVDDDDPTFTEYETVATNFNGFSWLHFWSGERLRLAGTLNYLAAEYAVDYDQIGFMGDDHRPRTPIWDGLMSAKLRELKTGLVYGNDLFQKEKLPTAVCMTADIIATLGYMVPPNMTHLYLDNFWLDLGKALGRIEYMENVVIEHLHPHAGKAETDAQYEELNSTEQDNRDKNAYETYRRKQFDRDVASIRAVML